MNPPSTGHEDEQLTKGNHWDHALTLHSTDLNKLLRQLG